MNTKTISYIVAAIGLIVLIVGAYMRFSNMQHGTLTLGIGAILLIAGLVGAFVLKPKAA